MEPDKWPSLSAGEGSIKTHKMASASVDIKGKRTAIAYPTIVFKDGKLVELSEDEAVRYAVRTGEYIAFSSDTEADYFARNYKSWREGQ